MMKRLISMFLICLLLPSLALAGGLSGLKKAQDLSLPDPAMILNVDGSLLHKDYEFSSTYLCNAYVYDYNSENVEQYLSAAQSAGYETRSSRIDGENGYLISSSDYLAMLVPCFDGQLLLMVENGMPFDGAAGMGTLPSARSTPGPQAAAAAEEETPDEYVKLTYNGRTYECASPMYFNGREVLHNAYDISLTPYKCKLTSISFTIPHYAASGDTFVAWKDHSITGLDFYVAEDNSFGRYYVSDIDPTSSFGLAASSDYYVLKVNSLELDGSVTVITGTIRARFLYDTTSYEIDFKVRVP